MFMYLYQHTVLDRRTRLKISIIFSKIDMYVYIYSGDIFNYNYEVKNNY